MPSVGSSYDKHLTANLVSMLYVVLAPVFVYWFQDRLSYIRYTFVEMIVMSVSTLNICSKNP